MQHHISRLQSSLRRYAYRLEFIEKRSSAVTLESIARRAMVVAARGGADLTPYTTMWFREGEEGRHMLAREVQRRVRGILERVRFVKKQDAGRCLAAVMRMRLGRMLFLGAKVFCGKGGQDRNTVITKMMGGHASGWRKVTPLWRTREYLAKHETMRGIHGAGIEWHRMHATVRQTFMEERRELTNIKTRAVLKIQSLFRGVAARKKVEVLEAERELEREAALAQRGGKLFSMYSNGERAVTLYVEWSVEKEIKDAPERYRAIQERGGGVFGVSVLCIRATESLVREREEMREEARKRREEQERVREARKREERQRVEHLAAVRIQCFYRCIRAVRRSRRLKSLLPKKKRPDPMGHVIEQMQKDYAKAILVLKETMSEWEDAKRRLQEARMILEEAQAVLVEVERGIERCVRVRKAAIAGRRHKEAGRARAEWERLCLSRERADADIDRMMPGMGEREAEAARLAEEVVLLDKDVKRRKHELDQFSYRKGRGRPPKHAGQLQAMVGREKRAVEGGSFGASSEVEREAALALQRVLRGHWARLEVGTRFRFRHRWRHASSDELQKLGLVQAQARGWIVRKRVRVLMMEMAEAAERRREEAEMKRDEEEYWRVEHQERYRSEKLELGSEGQNEGVHSRLQALEKEESVSLEQRLSQGGWFMRRDEKDTPEYKQRQLLAWVKKANQLRKDAFARISKASGRVEGAATMLDEAAKMLHEAQALYQDAGEHGRQGRQATAALRRAIVDRKAKLASKQAKYQNRVDQSNLSILSILEPKSRHSAKDSTPLEPPVPSSPGPRRHHGLTPSSPGGFGISDLPVSPVPHLSSPSGDPSQDANARSASASVGERLDYLMNESSLHANASSSRPTSEGGIASTPRPPPEPRSARQPSSRGRVVVQSLESGAKQARGPAPTVSNQASGPRRLVSFQFDLDCLRLRASTPCKCMHLLRGCLITFPLLLQSPSHCSSLKVPSRSRFLHLSWCRLLARVLWLCVIEPFLLMSVCRFIRPRLSQWLRQGMRWCNTCRLASLRSRALQRQITAT